MRTIKIKTPRPSVSENREQANLIDWWRWQFPEWDLLLFAIPNGGFRNPKNAAILKRTGVKAGVADLFLAFPSRGHCGLFIEMKRADGGVQSAAQKEFQEAVEKRNYQYALCHGFDEARLKILEYLNIMLARGL